MKNKTRLDKMIKEGFIFQVGMWLFNIIVQPFFKDNITALLIMWIPLLIISFILTNFDIKRRGLNYNILMYYILPVHILIIIFKFTL